MVSSAFTRALALSAIGAAFADHKKSSFIPARPQLSRLDSTDDEEQSDLVCRGVMRQLDVCNTQECPSKQTVKPIDGLWGAWSEWSVCSCTGVKERSRQITRHAKFGGVIPEGPTIESAPCTPECHKHLPKNCVVSDWDDWSECDKDCGGGQQFRERTIVAQPEYCGETCDASLKETRSCNQQSCDESTDCQLTPWNEWSVCDADCGGGQQYRSRDVLVQASFGGRGCVDPLVEVQGCNTACCANAEPVDCKWDDWQEWSACSAECDGGERTRERGLKVAPRNGGRWCDDADITEVEACNTQPCNVILPVDGLWSDWSEWSLCTEECGGGYQYRSRGIARSASNGGMPVSGDLQEYRQCNQASCDKGSRDCKFSDWGAWSDCSCPCNGHKDRSRRIVQYAKNGGAQCEGPLKQIDACNVDSKACLKNQAVDCKFSAWGEWSECSATCDGGDRFRERTIVQQAEHQGQPCNGDIKEIEPCNQQKCCPECDADKDCMWSEWQEWGACSVDCGGGQHTRYRHIAQQPKNNGRSCDVEESVQVEPCNKHQCGAKKYCVWGAWSKWSDCDQKCGGGQTVRERALEITSKAPSDADEEAPLAEDLLQNVHWNGMLSLGATLAMASVVIGAVALFAARYVRNASASLRNNEVYSAVRSTEN